MVAGASGIKRCPPIAMTTPTALSGSVHQNRRVKFSSSGFLSSSKVGMSGSSAIPQIGQLPGAGRRICGCIGHVYMVTALLSSLLWDSNGVGITGFTPQTKIRPRSEQLGQRSSMQLQANWASQSFHFPRRAVHGLRIQKRREIVPSPLAGMNFEWVQVDWEPNRTTVLRGAASAPSRGCRSALNPHLLCTPALRSIGKSRMRHREKVTIGWGEHGETRNDRRHRRAWRAAGQCSLPWGRYRCQIQTTSG